MADSKDNEGQWDGVAFLSNRPKYNIPYIIKNMIQYCQFAYPSNKIYLKFGIMNI